MDSGGVPRHQLAVASVTGLGLLAATLICLGQRRKAAAASEIPRERLVEVLRELATEFFHIALNFSNASKSVRRKLAGSVPAMGEEKFREQLAEEFKLYEKLRLKQAKVFEKHGVTEEAMWASQQRLAGDSEVASFEQGTQAMLEDAMQGEAPVLAGLRIPEALTEDKVAEIEAEIHSMEANLVIQRLGGKACSIKELEQVLVNANRDAWQQVLDTHSSLLGGRHEVFHSTNAFYSRRPDFAARKEVLAEAHKQRMLSLFKPRKDAGGPVPEEAAGPAAA